MVGLLVYFDVPVLFGEGKDDVFLPLLDYLGR